MLTAVRRSQILLPTLIYLCSTLAHAELALNSQRGGEVVQIPVPGKAAEICIIPEASRRHRLFREGPKRRAPTLRYRRALQRRRLSQDQQHQSWAGFLFRSPRVVSTPGCSYALQSRRFQENRKIQTEHKLQLYTFDPGLLSRVKNAGRYR